MGLLGKLLGHEVSYMGMETQGPTLGIFDNTFIIPSNFCLHIGLPHTRVQQRKIKLQISDINPDLIHLHNIYLYGIVADSGYPFILDDHECLSKEVYCDPGRRMGIKRKLAFPIQMATWWIREKNAAKNVPIVTVSDPIAQYYKDLSGNVQVIPNYPSEYELSRAKFSDKVEEFTSVYLGNTYLRDTCIYRDCTGFIEYFKEINKPLVCIGNSEHTPDKSVKFTGYIPHMDMFTEISKYHVGIIPWRQHHFHKYCSPNKAYYYAHCGMVVVVTAGLDSVIKRFKGLCYKIQKYEDLELLLGLMEENKDRFTSLGEKTKEFALKNFIFEKYKDVLKGAYQHA